MYAIAITRTGQQSKYRRFVAEDGATTSGRDYRIGPGDRIKLYKSLRWAEKTAAEWTGSAQTAEVVEGNSHHEIVAKYAIIGEEVKS